MGFSERVNVQCSIGKIKTAGKPSGAGLSTVGVPLSLPCLYANDMSATSQNNAVSHFLCQARSF